MPAPAKPTILFYGNCQAGALAVIFGADAAITSAFDIVYIASFDDRVAGKAAIGSDAIAAAAFLFEQHDPNEFPQRDLLTASCVTVTFPSIDFNLLWPLNCVNAFNDAPTAEYPWGRFPYGDGFIVDCVKRGLSAREATQLYDATAADHLPNLDRFASIEQARLTARDSKCDVTMGDFIMRQFRSENLFWSVNHPTMAALKELTQRIIDKANAMAPGFRFPTLDGAIASLPPEGPLGAYRIPVHPTVARHFNVTWYPDPYDKTYGPRDMMMTYNDYFLEMATCAVEVREANSIATTTF